MSRLGILIVVMAALAVGRLLFVTTEQPYATVQPIIRPPSRAIPQIRTASAKPAESTSLMGDRGDDVPGNAFAVRVPPAPSAPAIAAAPRGVPATTAAAFVGPVAPPVVATPPPNAPFQVVGTYDDGGLPAVFLATSSGTHMARQGSVVMSDYRVTSITQRDVAVTQISSARSFVLPVPGAVVR